MTVRRECRRRKTLMKCLQFGSWFCVIWTLQMRIKRFSSWFLFFPSFRQCAHFSLSLSFVAWMFIHFFFLSMRWSCCFAFFIFFFFLSVQCFKIRLNFASFARAISACRGFVVRLLDTYSILSVMLFILIHFTTMQTLFLCFHVQYSWRAVAVVFVIISAAAVDGQFLIDPSHVVNMFCMPYQCLQNVIVAAFQLLFYTASFRCYGSLLLSTLLHLIVELHFIWCDLTLVYPKLWINSTKIFNRKKKQEKKNLHKQTFSVRYVFDLHQTI